MAWTIRKTYLYLTSLISLIIILIGTISLINVALRAWIFTQADSQYSYCYERKPVPLNGGESAEIVEEPAQTDVNECIAQEKQQQTARRQAQATTGISMIIVGLPIYIYHWNKIKGEKND